MVLVDVEASERIEPSPCCWNNARKYSLLRGPMARRLHLQRVLGFLEEQTVVELARPSSLAAPARSSGCRSRRRRRPPGEDASHQRAARREAARRDLIPVRDKEVVDPPSVSAVDGDACPTRHDRRIKGPPAALG